MHTTRDIDIEVQIRKELTLGDYVFDDEAPAGVLEASGSGPDLQVFNRN